MIMVVNAKCNRNQKKSEFSTDKTHSNMKGHLNFSLKANFSIGNVWVTKKKLNEKVKWVDVWDCEDEKNLLKANQVDWQQCVGARKIKVELSL